MEDEYRIIDVTPKHGKSRFSKTELRDIGVSMLVLSIAFMLLYRDSSMMFYLDYHLGEVGRWVGLFAVCAVLVVFSFLLHEFGHKFVAQNHGMWSEFRMYPAGLFITLITSLIGFLFAAPGAVMISGYPDKRTNGLISIAGPTVNIVLAAVGIVGCLLTNGSALVLFFSMFAYLNAFLAFFNLLPIPPLDGSKIVSWNIPVYVVALAIAGIELAYLFVGMPDLMFTL